MSRSIAVAAYVAALAAPASANWQDVATSLFDCLPKSRGVTVEAGAPAWWATYKLGKQFRFDSMEVLFHDGETVRVTVATAPGKLPLIPSAVRGAIGFYRARNGQHVAVPAFASLTMVETGQTYDAATASRLTAELRAIPGTVQRKAMTVERVEWMAREVERRRAGMQRAQAEESARLVARAQRVKLGLGVAEVNAEVEAERLARFTSQPSSGWAESLAAGEAELALMREALKRERGDVDAVSQAVAPVVARPIPVSAPMDPEAVQAAWCEAVADAYAAPAGWEVTGTDPEAVEAIAAPMPVEAIAATGSDRAPVLSTGPTLSEMETVADEWEPTPETHPVIALALSDKARAALFDAVLDGTFPAEGNAKAGAWRVTLADALALQGLASIRWVGMPRKAYTRRAARVVTPFEAIEIHKSGPGEAIETIYPISVNRNAGRFYSPVTFHAAP